MKTLIDIDQGLMTKAMKMAGATTKKETVEIALGSFIKLCQRQRLKDLASSGILEVSLQHFKASRKIRSHKQSKIRASHN
jgi:hypothetical protein